MMHGEVTLPCLNQCDLTVKNSAQCLAAMACQQHTNWYSHVFTAPFNGRQGKEMKQVDCYLAHSLTPHTAPDTGTPSVKPRDIQLLHLNP